mmetsp:Transcript_33785/g.73871  ORF Transcript_33785/g.73871 Transcript_33785/m.73871 type:complete len:249 (+) Transcript_33785:27-773(+)
MAQCTLPQASVPEQQDWKIQGVADDAETWMASEASVDDESGDGLSLPRAGRITSAPATCEADVQYVHKNTFLEFFDAGQDETPIAKRASTTSAVESRSRSLLFHVDVPEELPCPPVIAEVNEAVQEEVECAVDESMGPDMWHHVLQAASAPQGGGADAWAARRWARLAAKMMFRSHLSVPIDETGALTSIGSQCHASGACCVPCLFHKKSKGCFDGIWCLYCHFPENHKVEKKSKQFSGRKSRPKRQE